MGHATSFLLLSACRMSARSSSTSAGSMAAAAVAEPSEPDKNALGMESDPFHVAHPKEEPAGNALYRRSSTKTASRTLVNPSLAKRSGNVCAISWRSTRRAAVHLSGGKSTARSAALV